jgi:hypothetical protein
MFEADVSIVGEQQLNTAEADGSARIGAMGRHAARRFCANELRVGV